MKKSIANETISKTKVSLASGVATVRGTTFALKCILRGIMKNGG